MSLASAVLEIADQMTKEALIGTGKGMQAFADQLRTAVKAAEGQSTGTSTTMPFLTLKEESNQARHWLMRAAERKQRQQAEQAEWDQQSSSMVRLVGGTFDGDSIPCLANTPIGHTIDMGGQKYVLDNDGKFHLQLGQESEK